MSAEDVIAASRLTHVRELKTRLDKLTAEKTALESELGVLKAHLDLAIVALAELKDGGKMEIWDGWNLLLSSDKVAKSREELFLAAQASGKRVWIVFDGHEENVKTDGKVRVSYTGGEGEQRADRFILDFVRAAKYLGLSERVGVRTFDKTLGKSVARLGGDLV